MPAPMMRERDELMRRVTDPGGVRAAMEPLVVRSAADQLRGVATVQSHLVERVDSFSPSSP